MQRHLGVRPSSALLAGSAGSTAAGDSIIYIYIYIYTGLQALRYWPEAPAALPQVTARERERESTQHMNIIYVYMDIYNIYIYIYI
jgi:hypothetical protein